VAALAYVDSGGWIALLSRRDRHHAEATRVFRAVVRRHTALVTSNLVLAEVHRLLLFRAGIQAALAAVERITRIDRLSVEFVTAAHHAAALEWIRRFADQPFTYADATSFAVMAGRRCRHVIGFDRHFQIAGFERWLPGSA
jgi:predicted nucleic acid-binding protein